MGLLGGAGAGGGNLGKVLLATVLCVSWAGVSSLLIMLNQHLLNNGFPYPTLLASLGQLFSFCVAFTLYKARLFEPKAAVTPHLWLTKCRPIGLANAVTLSTGNQVYLYLSVSFIQMLKAGTPVVTMCTLFACRMEKPRLPLIGSVFVIFCGCFIAAWGEVAFNLFGFGLMMTSEFAEASKLVATQALLGGIGGISFTLLEGLLYITPGAWLWMMLFACFGEIPALLENGDLAVVMAQPWTFFLAASLGIGVNALTLGIVKTTNSLTFKVVGQAKNVCVVMLGVVVLGNIVTATQWLGYSIAVVGFFLYQQALANKSKDPPLPPSKGDDEDPEAGRK